MPERVDLQKFLTDPAFQADRELMEGVVNYTIEKRIAAEKEKQKAEGGENFFDRVFGGKSQ